MGGTTAQARAGDVNLVPHRPVANSPDIKANFGHSGQDGGADIGCGAGPAVISAGHDRAILASRSEDGA